MLFMYARTVHIIYVRLFANQGNMTDIQRDRDKQTIRPII